jgi:VIT family
VAVAGATSERGPIFTAALAGLVAGAVSMALGERISVSSQRDSETALCKCAIAKPGQFEQIALEHNRVDRHCHAKARSVENGVHRQGVDAYGDMRWAWG